MPDSKCLYNQINGMLLQQQTINSLSRIEFKLKLINLFPNLKKSLEVLRIDHSYWKPGNYKEKETEHLSTKNSKKKK